MPMCRYAADNLMTSRIGGVEDKYDAAKTDCVKNWTPDTRQAVDAENKLCLAVMMQNQPDAALRCFTYAHFTREV